MVYVDRITATVIKVRVSCDHGRTWPDEMEAVIYRRESVSRTGKRVTTKDDLVEQGKLFNWSSEELSGAEFDATLHVNLTGAFNLARKAAEV